MKCKLCGYYYSTHEKGTVCQHCGGNRDGLEKTRLMTISKIIAVLALLVPVIAIIFNSDWSYAFRKAYGFIELHEGNAGCGSIMDFVWWVLPFVYIFTISALFRVKRCNFGLYLTSSLLLLPFAILFFMDEKNIMYIIMCILLMILAVIAKIDKQNQKFRNKNRS